MLPEHMHAKLVSTVEFQTAYRTMQMEVPLALTTVPDHVVGNGERLATVTTLLTAS